MSNTVFFSAILVVILLGALSVGLRRLMFKKPLNEMTRVVNSLAEGNVNVVYDEKFKKGEHELAQMMRQLSKLTGALKNN